MLALVVTAAAEGNPKVFIATAIGLLLIVTSGPVSRLLTRGERSLGRGPASAANPLLNPERAEAIRDWRASGGGAGGYRAVQILGGLLFVVLSLLLYLGVIS
jgi:hypothetical protein